MKQVNLTDLQDLQNAISDVIGFVTDNSCFDPDCCGGPYYTDREFDDGLEVLKKFGLEWHDSFQEY